MHEEQPRDQDSLDAQLRIWDLVLMRPSRNDTTRSEAGPQAFASRPILPRWVKPKPAWYFSP